MKPLVELVGQHAQQRPNKVAIVASSTSLSYGELWTNALACATWLSSQGVRAGARVLWRCHHGDPWFAVGYLATHMNHAMAAPVDAKIPPDDLERIARQLEPTLIASSNELPKRLSGITGTSLHHDLVPPSMDSVADVLFTGGSTSVPKGVTLSHFNVASAVTNINAFIGNGPDDREVITIPLSHSFGLGRLRCNLAAGATAILVPGLVFPALTFKAIAAHRATGLACVPAGASLLLKWGGERIAEWVDQLRYVEIGSSAMPLETKRLLMKLLPKTRICMHYGLTEASRSAFLEFHTDAQYLESAGRAAPNVEIRICSEEGAMLPAGTTGRIQIKAGTVMRGYWRDPERTARALLEDGWLDTGDLGRLDADGYLYLAGRREDLINVGGRKVFPSTVENAAVGFPGVRECACIGVPDPVGVLGEVPALYVVSASADSFDRDDLLHFLAARLEPHAVPRRVELIEALPKTEAGKIRRSELRRQIAG